MNAERRRALRRQVGSGEPLASARLRTGGQLRLVDAASHGALVETNERLLPGRHLDVHVVSVNGRVLVRARVARAYVSHVSHDVVRYRAALAFDRPVDVRADGYAVPALLSAVDGTSGKSYPLPAPPGDIEFAERLSA